MNSKNSMNWRGVRSRLAVWLGLSLAVALLFFRDVWAGLPGMLTNEGLRRTGVYGWGILGVCLFWVFLKRDSIHAAMSQPGTGRRYLLLGLAMVGLMAAMPAGGVFAQVFRLLGVSLGVFTVLFGAAALIPGFVLAVYGFSLVFPVLTQPLAEGVWGKSTLDLVVALAPAFGLSLDSRGNMVSVVPPGGERISALVTSECAGQITMGIFISLFALMMLDVRLPWRRALVLFLFGVFGSTFQNLVRIELVLLSAQWWGWAGFNAAHQYVAYVIFPAWYAVFAAVYFNAAKRR
ncbi:MAG: archaeosortase/exosortase family protein [Chloroflexi bacterium]|nr:archaeosortase/exosortase family protein [Chloroflexota bacterium]